MAKKFPKDLRKAWMQYQDLYDKYMGLLRRLGEGDINGAYKALEAQIEYAMTEWSSPDERFDAGCFEDFDFNLDGDEEE